MSGEYETPVTAAPRPRNVRSISGSIGKAWSKAVALRLALEDDSCGEPPAAQHYDRRWDGHTHTRMRRDATRCEAMPFDAMRCDAMGGGAFVFVLFLQPVFKRSFL